MRISKMVVLTILACVILGTSLSVQPTFGYVRPRYHTGYVHEDGYSHEGVYGCIYTIDPSVPNPTVNFVCEWVDIVLSYTIKNKAGDYGLWLQIGYIKGLLSTTLKYYVEVMAINSTGQLIHDFYIGTTFFPKNGETHAYGIRRPYPLSWDIPRSSDPSEFRFYIDNMGSTGVLDLHGIYPYPQVDEQAFVETNITAICITGSHFTELHTYDVSTANPFNVWTRHTPVRESPVYTLTEVSNIAFYASGGG